MHSFLNEELPVLPQPVQEWDGPMVRSNQVEVEVDES